MKAQPGGLQGTNIEGVRAVAASRTCGCAVCILRRTGGGDRASRVSDAVLYRGCDGVHPSVAVRGTPTRRKTRGLGEWTIPKSSDGINRWNTKPKKGGESVLM